MKWLNWKRLRGMISKDPTGVTNMADKEISPGGNAGSDFIKMLREHPELVEHIENSLKKLGENPIPKIIQLVITEGFTNDALAMGSIWLSYIGKPAIPHLVNLLGHENNNLAMFASKTLSSIEGSLPHIRNALKSKNFHTRLHAAGSLQSFGSKAVDAIPDLYELIRSEIIESGETEAGKMSQVASIAASALGKIGKPALARIRDLMENDNVNVRLSAICATIEVGKPALPILLERRGKEKNQFVFAALEHTIRTIEGE